MTIFRSGRPGNCKRCNSKSRHDCGGCAYVIRFALKSIEPSDVILVDMWRKYKDQVAENVGYVRKVLKPQS
jgi:hypothetical protein